jgi:hypothetical protein
MSQKIANQQIVIRLDRADKYPPVIPENKVPLPLGIGQSNNWHHCTEANAARVRQ